MDCKNLSMLYFIDFNEENRICIMQKTKIHVHLLVDLKRALYDNIGIKLVLHLSVWSVSSLLSVTYPSVFLCLPFLYIAFLETNSSELIARNHFHCRFLSGGLQ